MPDGEARRCVCGGGGAVYNKPGSKEEMNSAVRSLPYLLPAEQSTQRGCGKLSSGKRGIRHLVSCLEQEIKKRMKSIIAPLTSYRLA